MVQGQDGSTGRAVGRSSLHCHDDEKPTRKTKTKVGVGRAGISAAIRELRKQYGPMLKRLACK